MGQREKEKILRVYFEEPNIDFTVRKLSSKTKIAKSTVQRTLSELKKENLISKGNEIVESNFFKITKVNYYVKKIVESGLLDYLINELNPSLIVLFGSIRKGDSVKSSDLDIFVESFINKTLKLEKFERRLGHKIDLFVENDLDNLHQNLKENVVNGIKLYGFLKLK
jgi:predicted nucleotidyltransferase